MAGLFGKVAKFASSPQGRRLIEKGKDAANDPKNRAKIEQAASKLRKKGGQPPA
ncbi:MAG: hypothetical protein JWN77_2873 [Frankiales bacterium]|nr:hypothetical protein [Frankiales bacterium]